MRRGILHSQHGVLEGSEQACEGLPNVLPNHTQVREANACQATSEFSHHLLLSQPQDSKANQLRGAKQDDA